MAPPYPAFILRRMKISFGRVLFFAYVILAILWWIRPTAISWMDDLWYADGRPDAFARRIEVFAVGLIVYLVTIQFGTKTGRI